MPLQETTLVRLGQPTGNCVGILLVGSAVLLRIPIAKDRRVDLGDDRFVLGHFPAVERPEMHFVADLLSDAPQPRDSGVRGFGDGALNIE